MSICGSKWAFCFVVNWSLFRLLSSTDFHCPWPVLCFKSINTIKHLTEFDKDLTFSLVLYHFSNLARSHIMLRMFHNFTLKYPKFLVPSPCAVSPPKCNTGSCVGRWLLCVVPVSNSLLTWLASCCCPARAHRTLNHCSCYITIYFCVTANIFFSVSTRC